MKTLFLEDITYHGKLVWEQNRAYDVWEESPDGYFFIINNEKVGISKEYENIKYIIIGGKP